MAKTNKQNIRAVRQDELRAKLAAGGHLQYAIENIEKIEALKYSVKTALKRSFELSKYKIAAELRLRIVNKYLPDLKAMELTTETGEVTPIIIQIVNPHDANTSH